MKTLNHLADLVVFHPNTIKDFSVLNQVKNAAVENMDFRKFGKTFEDMKKVFEQSNVLMCYDVFHAYSVDTDFIEGNKMKQAFKDKIKEVHISGGNRENHHILLCETKQDEIVKNVSDLKVPLIIESCIPDIDSLKKEVEFIKNNL